MLKFAKNFRVRQSKEAIAAWFQSLQDDICNKLVKMDGAQTFKEDLWERPGGGGGRSRILNDGALIEKGGVNFSAVHGALPENIKNALKVDEEDFFATGVSIVLHPKNPFVPIIHMNVRYFELKGGETHWFGGGIDVTPHLVLPKDAKAFHQHLEQTCNFYSPDYYPKFKKWADDYFYIKHRQETRGIGGIFFDRLGETPQFSHNDRFEFVQAIGNSFVPIYQRLSNDNRLLDFTEDQRHWQLMRRGRYVEFNLVYDRGTKFGLDTNGRIESILMSMPPLAEWQYDFKPKAGSLEAKTLNWLKKDIDWLNHRGESDGFA